jgi:tetratricopeptide (TPR) repeat protein
MFFTVCINNKQEKKGAWKMLRREMVVGMVLALFVLSASCFADAALQISKADKCMKAGNCNKAEEIYKAVLQSEGKSDLALKAQRKLITLYIHTDRNSEAQADFDKMLADYAGNPNLAEEIYWVGRGYRVAEDYGKATSLYQKVIEQYPNSPFANRSRINIQNMEVWSLIKAGQIEQAKTQFGKMVQDFSSESYLPEAMFWTARKFRQANQYEEATNIYTQMIQKYPQDSFSNKAVVELSNCMIQQLIEKGKHNEAIAAIGKMFTDNANNPQVLSVASRIAELYQVKSREFDKQGNTAETQASLARSAAILEMMIAKAPAAANIAETYCLAGDCYYRIGNYGKSVDCYKKVLTEHPDYEGRWNAQFMVGRNYEAMKKAGQMSGAEADGKIKEAYEHLLAEYPDCQAARHARKWLGR